MEENNDTIKDIDLWATNSEEGGWNISSTDEGSQKMLEQEDEVTTKIQMGSEVIDDYFIEDDISDDERMILNMWMRIIVTKNNVSEGYFSSNKKLIKLTQ